MAYKAQTLRDAFLRAIQQGVQTSSQLAHRWRLHEHAQSLRNRLPSFHTMAQTFPMLGQFAQWVHEKKPKLGPDQVLTRIWAVWLLLPVLVVLLRRIFAVCGLLAHKAADRQFHNANITRSELSRLVATPEYQQWLKDQPLQVQARVRVVNSQAMSWSLSIWSPISWILRHPVAVAAVVVAVISVVYSPDVNLILMLLGMCASYVVSHAVELLFGTGLSPGIDLQAIRRAQVMLDDDDEEDELSDVSEDGAESDYDDEDSLVRELLRNRHRRMREDAIASGSTGGRVGGRSRKKEHPRYQRRRRDRAREVRQLVDSAPNWVVQEATHRERLLWVTRPGSWLPSIALSLLIGSSLYMAYVTTIHNDKMLWSGVAFVLAVLGFLFRNTLPDIALSTSRLLVKRPGNWCGHVVESHSLRSLLKYDVHRGGCLRSSNTYLELFFPSSGTVAQTTGTTVGTQANVGLVGNGAGASIQRHSLNTVSVPRGYKLYCDEAHLNQLVAAIQQITGDHYD